MELIKDKATILAQDWQQWSEQKLKYLQELKPNWDTYGSPSIDQFVIQAARQVIGAVMALGADRPDIFPVSGGGLQIEWDDDLHGLDVEIFPNRKPEVFGELPSGWLNECQVQTDTFCHAIAVLYSLPSDLPLPSIGAEADGHVCLEWMQNPGWIVSVSVSLEKIVYYAALLGDRNPRGREPFAGSLSDKLIDLIREVVNGVN